MGDDADAAPLDVPRRGLLTRRRLLMGMLAWVMMGLALWHFTIWLPDRYWGGIVGAFVGALVGAALFGLIISGFQIPGRHTTHLSTALEAVPGALIGVALVYLEGLRRERADPRRRVA